MATTDWRYPLYPVLIHDDLRCEIIGGPCWDIDDVLDACWDRCLADNLDVEKRCFVIETGAGDPAVRAFPEGAFPARDTPAEPVA